jgi:hypothetical protein
MNLRRQRIYEWLGRRLFPRRQDWQQRQDAKILAHTVAFSLTLGVVMAELIRYAYNHKR